MEFRNSYEGRDRNFRGLSGPTYLPLTTPLAYDPLGRGVRNFPAFPPAPGHLPTLPLTAPPSDYAPLSSDFVEFWDSHLFLSKAEREFLQKSLKICSSGGFQLGSLVIPPEKPQNQSNTKSEARLGRGVNRRRGP